MNGFLTPFYTTIILYILLIFGNRIRCERLQTTRISDSMSCFVNNMSYAIPIPVNAQSSSNAYLISLKLQNSNTLPVVLTVFNNIDEINKFNADITEQNKTINFQAIQLNKEKQNLLFFPPAFSSLFYVAIFRVNLGEYNYVTNTDRGIQGFDGTNDNFIYSCKMTISFTLTISFTKFLTSFQIGVKTPPLSFSDCKNGIYNESTQSCLCNLGYGMPLCDVYFNQIANFGETHSSFLDRNEKQYFYFEATSNNNIDINNYISVKIGSKNSSTNKNYINEKHSVQFTILFLIQKISDPLNVPTIFNQMNPSNLDEIELQYSERLVIAVYKPLWATADLFEITLFSKQKKLDLFITIFLSILFVTVSAFIFYILHYKRRQLQQEILSHIGMATPVRHHKIINDIFQIDKHFPSISYKQMQQVMIVSKSYQNNSLQVESLNGLCSICLNLFKDLQEVKLTYCGHIFDHYCLVEWVRRQPTCPLCRKWFNNREMERINEKMGINGLNLTSFQKNVKMLKWIKNSKQEIIFTYPQTTHNINLGDNHNYTNF